MVNTMFHASLTRPSILCIAVETFETPQVKENKFNVVGLGQFGYNEKSFCVIPRPAEFNSRRDEQDH